MWRGVMLRREAEGAIQAGELVLAGGGDCLHNENPSRGFCSLFDCRKGTFEYRESQLVTRRSQLHEQCRQFSMCHTPFSSLSPLVSHPNIMHTQRILPSGQFSATQSYHIEFTCPLAKAIVTFPSISRTSLNLWSGLCLKL